jgi:hypothetical protein
MARWERNLDAFMAQIKIMIDDGIKSAEPQIDRKVGTVHRVHLKTAPPTVDVLVGDADGINAIPPHANIYPNLKFGGGYKPIIGDQVVVLKKGMDFWVINSVQNKLISDIVNANELNGFKIAKTKPKKGDGLIFNGTEWVPTPSAAYTFTQEKTWAIQGSLLVPSGTTNYIPETDYNFPAGESGRLVSLTAKIQGGTSATIKIELNGVAIAAWTGLVITTTKSYHDLVAPIKLRNKDSVQPVITAISASPAVLSLTVYNERTTSRGVPST